MPAARAQRPRPRAQVIAHEVGTPAATERMVAQLSEQVERQERPYRSSVTVNLVVGTNRVVHGLGRVPKGATLTPSEANLNFAWGITSADERIAVIAVVGSDMPRVVMEFY